MSEPNIIKFQFYFCRQSIPKVEENHNFQTEKFIYYSDIVPNSNAKKKKKYNKNICTKYNLICYPL